MTLPDDVEEVLDRLPEGRDLLPDEALDAAVALDADAVSRLTYSDEGSDAVAVWSTLLWWSDSGAVVMLIRGAEGWDLDLVVLGASHAGFLDAVDRVADRFDAEGRSGEVLKLTDSGEVVDRFDRDL